MPIQYRSMEQSDSSQVARLLQANAASNQGGLLGEFPLPKVHAMLTGSKDAVIACDSQKIIAVVFSFKLSSKALPPIAHYILEKFPNLLSDNWFYGPVCIDTNYRGKNILKTLYRHICALNTGKPVAFINTLNSRSLSAHQKLGMTIAANFTFEGTAYYLVIGG